MFKNILLATEGTKSMDRIIGYVSDLFSDSGFHVLSVVNTSAASINRAKLLLDHFDKRADEALARARHILEDKDIKARYVKGRGIPAKEIIKYISHNHVDLVVLGSSAQRGISKMSFGHVGEHIITMARCPVLVLNKNGKFVMPESILNPTDGETHSFEAGILATNLANYFGATLYKCYMGQNEEKGEHILDEASTMAKEMGVREVGICTLVAGDPADRIILQSKNHDMMVLGKGRKCRFCMFLRYLKLDKAGLLGITSREVAALSGVPVFLTGH